MPNPSTWKRGQLTQKCRRPHVFQESPCDRGCLLTFPQISEVFYMGSQPGSRLARTQHHSPKSSGISWKAPHFPAALPPPALRFLSPPALAAAPRAIPLPPCPARRCHNLTALTLAAGAFRAVSLLRYTSATAGASCIPRQNQGPLARGTEWRHVKTWFPASEKFPPQKREPAEQNTAANGTRSLGRPGFKNKQAPWAGKVLVHFCSYVNNSKLLLLAGLEADGITGNSGG